MGFKWECPADQTCSTWALSYFMDCLCSQRDMISFFLGITSLFCWAAAEIPQIVVSWRSDTVEGVSMAFIFTWMIGDIFNLLGCWINPGTLPTQFYLAVLYSSTTLLLVVKQIWSTWASCRDSPNWPFAEPLLGYGQSYARSPRRPSDLEGSFSSDSALVLTPAISSQSLPVMSKRGRPPLYETGSLPVSSNSREPREYPGSMPAQLTTRSPSFYSGWRRLTLSNSFNGNGSGSPMTPRSPMTRGLMFSLVVVGVTFIVLCPLDGSQSLKPGVLKLVGGERRELLQKDDGQDVAQSVGLILGWLMTCVYLTGRLPQMILNWSRDFVIGVSVATLMFAFLGNATYLGSILVRGVEWSKLKPVLPWVVDITCCLLMDLFMTWQFLIRHLKDSHAILE